MKRCLNCQQVFAAADWLCPQCTTAPMFADGIPLFAPELTISDANYDAADFARITQVQDKNFWFRSRNRLITEFIGACFPEARRFLEVGVGTGVVHAAIAAAHPQLELHASEMLLSGVRQAREKLKDLTRLYQMDARKLPFESEFDLIGAFDVIEHIQEDEQVLRAMRRALRPGGGILLTVPQHPWLWSHEDEQARHKRRYTAPDLHARIERNGFKILRSTSFVTLLLPALAATRWFGPGRRGATDPTTGLRLPGPVNAILYGVMETERRLLLPWFDLPLGGSRIVAARAVA